MTAGRNAFEGGTAARRSGWGFRVGVVGLLALAVAGVPGRGQAAEPAPALTLCTWDAYTAPEVIEAFRSETGVAIRLETVLSYEALEQRLRTPGSGCDVAVPADYQIADMIRDGVIDRINAWELPGFGNVDEGWLSRPFDPHNEYSVPFHWGTASFVIDSTVWDGDIDNYAVLFDPPPVLAGRISLLQGATSLTRMALIHLKRPPCSVAAEDLEAARALIAGRFVRPVIASIADVIDVLASDRVAGGIAWNGDAMRARARKPTLRYAYPREGVVVWTDSLVVLKGSVNREAARAFLAFMLRPENAARQTNYTGYANSIRGSDAGFLPELLEAPEVVAPTAVRLNFQGFCERTAQVLHDQVFYRLIEALEQGDPPPSSPSVPVAGAAKSGGEALAP